MNGGVASFTEEAARSIQITAPLWRSRICESAICPATGYLANEKNGWLRSREQHAAQGGVLGEVSWAQQVIVNRRSAPAWKDVQNVETLIDGYLHISMALERSAETEMPVLFLDLGPENARLAPAKPWR